jgi:hypothetical protein
MQPAASEDSSCAVQARSMGTTIQLVPKNLLDMDAIKNAVTKKFVDEKVERSRGGGSKAPNIWQ